MKRLKWILVGSALVAVPVLVGVIGVTIVQASTDPIAISSIVVPEVLAQVGIGEGVIDKQQLLADALGISVEELEAAQQAAFEASVAAAVDEGRITQEQADQILGREGFLGRGFGMRGFGRHAFGPEGSASEIGYGSLLAGELGISVEELQAAHQSASEAALDQLLDEGILTEEQAETARAAAALKEYMDKASLHAEALGMSVSELEAAKEAGKSFSEILEEQGVDAATYRENLAAVTEAAIEQAVTDGVISQEQADNLGSGRMLGFGHGRGFGWGKGGELPEGFEPGEGFGPGRGWFGGELPEGFEPGEGFGPGRRGFPGRARYFLYVALRPSCHPFVPKVGARRVPEA